MFTSPGDWVPAEFEERERFERFVAQFKELDTLIVSWPGCTIDDPRLARLQEALRGDDGGSKAQRCQDLFSRVSTGQSEVRELMQAPLSLSRRQATDRLAGSYVGKKVFEERGIDGRASCAVVVFSIEGSARRDEAVDLLLEVAQDACGLPPQDFHLAGPPLDGVTIDRHSVASINTFSLVSGLIVLLMCRICLRSWRFSFIVFGIAGLGQGLSVALAYFSGYRMNAILIVMPPLALVLTVSAGVHLVNYYHDEARRRGVEGAAQRAIANGWAPCLLAAATTIIGLLSLLASDIEPIRIFAIFSSITLVVTVFLLFMALPGVMELCPVAPRTTSSSKHDRSLNAVLDRFYDRLSALVCRFKNVIAIGGIAVMLVAGFGLSRLQTSVSVTALFAPESRILRDYRWLEEHIGPTVPIEVVLRFDDDAALGQLERLEFVREVQSVIDGMSHVGGTISAATYFPDWSKGDVDRTAELSRRLDALRPWFVERHQLYENGTSQSWRISTHVAALRDIDYGMFLGRLKERVAPLIDRLKTQRGVSGVQAIYTGGMPLAYDTQRALLNDLLVSFLTALALISIVMMLLLRSVRAGVITMIPNIFPTVVLFGAISWRNVPIDIGTVMTASIALGIAVDDTLHFLTWFRREYAVSGDRSDAVRKAFRHCARAMTQTTLICGLGLLVYTLSLFVPTRRFSWMMLALLFAALAGDLILLPALLAGPAGKLFQPRRKAGATKDGETESETAIADEALTAATSLRDRTTSHGETSD